MYKRLRRQVGGFWPGYWHQLAPVEEEDYVLQFEFLCVYLVLCPSVARTGGVENLIAVTSYRLSVLDQTAWNFHKAYARKQYVRCSVVALVGSCTGTRDVFSIVFRRVSEKTVLLSVLFFVIVVGFGSVWSTGGSAATRRPHAQRVC